MILDIFKSINFHTYLLLFFALVFVFIYELINGFHDTANAVATIIYTRAMQSQLAVVMAAIFNFFGVILSGLSVAYTIVHMLPTHILLNISSSNGISMIFSVLLAAIIWNTTTWYLGLPASSSHTLIGTIIGIGVTNAFITGTSVVKALNLTKLFGVFSSLILSPIIGIVMAGSIIFMLRRYWNGTKKKARIHLTPIEREKKDGKKKPPFWTRVLLIFSAIGVAFSHGANDGQKGIGLIMLVLIAITPESFIVKINASNYEITRTRDALTNLKMYFQQHPELIKNYYMLYKTNNIKDIIQFSEIWKLNNLNKSQKNIFDILFLLDYIKLMLDDVENYYRLNFNQRNTIRNVILYITDITDKISHMPQVSFDDKFFLKNLINDMLNTIEYAPIWIIVSVAMAIGIGTMIGWRRVAITIGEKIGKKSITYAQGMSAQITAAISIGIASYLGMPVSTTHVLSSSIAGAMIVDGNRLKLKTINSIVIAWMLTLPISILLSGSIYWLSLFIIN